MAYEEPHVCTVTRRIALDESGELPLVTGQQRVAPPFRFVQLRDVLDMRL